MTATTLVPPVAAEVEEFRNCIGGEWRRARGNATAHSSPGGALGGGQDPGADTVGIVDLVQALHEGCEDLLEHVCRGVIVQASAAWNGMNESLISINQGFPGLLITPAAGSHESCIACLNHSPIVTLRLQATHQDLRNAPYSWCSAGVSGKPQDQAQVCYEAWTGVTTSTMPRARHGNQGASVASSPDSGESPPNPYRRLI